MEKPFGIIEGFFGPSWSWEFRQHLAKKISSAGGNFYFYAPKNDPYLRKSWQIDFPTDHFNHLKKTRAAFKASGVQFGIGLSPFELHHDFSKSGKELLLKKLLKIDELGPDYLGLFLDDMKPAADLAKVQIEMAHFIKEHISCKLSFCPSYYSFDPILEKVFGKCPDNYLEELGANLDSDIDILWTGEKVTSKSITSQHLGVVEKIIRRKPFIWDNLFANDGPRQCKFLKVLPFNNRKTDAFEYSSGWGINPMNQGHLSALVFESAAGTLLNSIDPTISLNSSIEKNCPKDLASLIKKSLGSFNDLGLEGLEQKEKEVLRNKFSQFDHPVALEISSWLKGEFDVDGDCLTD
ncbi:MAG: hyaluronidase [Bacteriovoracaceae bacterium]|nr:hyaluronidase [Bacteriovoracaceae bacterium]